MLHAYVHDGSQAAFAELVRRHVDLVYSAARRQVSDEHTARDVAQSVFLDLARQARRFQPDQPLAPWLYVVTRRTAIDHVRREARRAANERAAAEIAPMNESPADWSRLGPLLDQAMARLDERDRAALVLRYFQNRSLREIGAALGASDDTAQKRVSRALDKLRGYFAARGLTVTAAALATEVAVHAVQPAPAGLIAAIGAALPAAALPFAGTGMGLVLRKLTLGALAAAVAGGVVIEVRRHVQQRAQLAALAHEQSVLAARIETSRQDREASARRTREIEERLARRQSESPAVELDAEVAAWFGRVTRLKQLAAESPQWTVPELRLLADRDWFEVARDATFDTGDSRRELLKALRDRARAIVGSRLRRGLVAYLDEHDGVLPVSVDELASYVHPTLDPDILARYEMRAKGKVSAFDRKAWLIAERSIVDEPHGTRLGISRGIYETLSAAQVPDADFRRAVQAFVSEHPGSLPQSPAEVLPYFAESLSPIQREEFLRKPPTDFSGEAIGRLLTPN
jgi:RNA polymerase sigma factor (sigma-70 family)